MARVLTYGALVAGALVLQLTVLDLLPLPGGIAPDLVLLVVVALALSSGPLPGLVTGFAAGLALDLAPPASHAIGAYALVFCLVGYVCGRVADEVDKSAILPLVAMALGAFAGSILYTVVGVTFGEPGVTWAAARNMLPVSVAYDVLLSPFVLYLVLRLTSRAWQKADDPAAALARAGSPGTFNAGRPAGAQKQPKEPRLRPGAGRPRRESAREHVAACWPRAAGHQASGAVAPAERLRAGGRRRCRGCGSGGRGCGARVLVCGRRGRRGRRGCGSGGRGCGAAGAGCGRRGRRGAVRGVEARGACRWRPSRTARLRFGGSGLRGAGAGVRPSRPSRTARLRFGGSGLRGAGAVCGRRGRRGRRGCGSGGRGCGGRVLVCGRRGRRGRRGCGSGGRGCGGRVLVCGRRGRRGRRGCGSGGRGCGG